MLPLTFADHVHDSHVIFAQKSRPQTLSLVERRKKSKREQLIFFSFRLNLQKTLQKILFNENIFLRILTYVMKN